jgi:signal transduction histidine kinase
MNQYWIRIGVAAWLSAWGGSAYADAVDPRNPVEWRAMQAATGQALPHWLPSRIRQLEQERDQLLEQISLLPQFEQVLISDRLGYHSDYADPGSESGDHQLTVHFRYRPYVGAVALVPAINPRHRHGNSYAFPRRFRIEMLIADGTWSVEQNRWENETFRWVTLADWWEEDFPDPGRYPVFFSAQHGRVRKVRMTVPREDPVSGHAFYALGELFLFQSVDGKVADNMSVWGPPSIEEFEVGDSFSLPPYWDLGYMHDGLTGLGVPLSEQKAESNDFMVRFDRHGASSEPVRLVFDLGQIQRVGRVEFWQAEAPADMVVPLYAFPGRVRVELSSDPDFNSAKTIEINDARAQMYHDNLLRVMCEGYDARYIRFTLEGLREENGRTILGFGEVSISEHGKVFSQGCKVTATGLPEAAQEQLDRLVDGICHGRRILSETEWIMGLAQRRPLDRRLAVVNRELDAARAAWRSLKIRFGIWGGSLVCVGLVVVMVLQRLQRRRVLKRLKTRITRDLHDEVGSSLGGLSLTSSGLAHMTDDDDMKEALDDLSLMAREACASLREVVWVTDQDVIRLPALIDKMQERAERILSGVEVTEAISPDLPDIPVSLNCKRHLIMFFREAVHNCARHAGAEKVRVMAGTVDGRLLELCIEDDGRGFELHDRQRGWGLDSMKQRAEELLGDLTICSAPGEGTRIRLTVPFDALSREPTKAYKTSN